MSVRLRVRVPQALVFGYVIGEIGTLIASLDRQGALVEEKMDAVKEYLTWRRVPKTLSKRVRRYYEYYYTQAAVFDEGEILNQLTPHLQDQVVKVVTSATLLKVPMMRRVDPHMYKHVFPLLKPLELGAGDVVYERGKESYNLCFLTKGEVLTLSPIDDASPEIRMTPTTMLLYDAEGRVIVTLEGDTSPSGCFGHSVFTGTRRRTSCVATMLSELLTIDKEALVGLFALDPANASRLAKIVMLAHKRSDALIAVASRVRISTMSEHSQLACSIQRHFRKYLVQVRASRYDELYKLVHCSDEDGGGGEAEAAAAPKQASIVALEAGLAQLTSSVERRFGSLDEKLDEILRRQPSPPTGLLSTRRLLRPAIASSTRPTEETKLAAAPVAPLEHVAA